MKYLIGLLTLCILTLSSCGFASALDSRVQLSITPRLCSIDVVNDGSNQTVQLPSLDCQKVFPALPSLPAPEGGTPVFVLPVRSATDKQTAQVAIRPQVEGT